MTSDAIVHNKAGADNAIGSGSSGDPENDSCRKRVGAQEVERRQRKQSENSFGVHSRIENRGRVEAKEDGGQNSLTVAPQDFL